MKPTYIRRIRRKPAASKDSAVFRKEGQKENTFFGEAAQDTFFQPTPVIQRKCDKCEEEDKQVKRMPEKKEEEKQVQRMAGKEEEDKKVARKETTAQGQPASTGAYLDNINGKGHALPPRAQQFFGDRMGYDFSDVKIHTGAEAAQSARDINARAYTYKNHVVFEEGKYNTESAEGKKLLAHELTHVIQQNNEKVHRAPNDPDVLKGNEIMANAPDGLKIAIFDRNESEMVSKAGEWATAENAVGFKGKKSAITFSDLTFGKAISDANDAAATINGISSAAKVCVEKAAKEKGVAPGEQHKIKALAFFAHGSVGWCSITPVSGTKGKKLVGDVAANLKNDITMIIYACTVASSDFSDDWYKGTLDAGGKGSLAAGVRDALFDNNIKAGQVWGHTTVGHVTDNFALRYFGSAAKDMEGLSYVSEYIFTPYDEYLIRQDVKKELTDQGYDISALDEMKLSTWQFEALRNHFYGCYALANKEKKYNGRNLAEAAPMHPREVARIVNDYWKDPYWGKIKTKYLKEVIKKFKLTKKAP